MGALRRNAIAGGYLALRTGVIGALLAGPFVAVPHAEAASCSALKSQLASLPSGGQSRSAGGAARKQQREMTLMQTQLDKLRCNAKSRLFSGEPAACRAGRRVLRRMEANLAKLQQLGGGGSSSTRRRLERKIRSQGCNGGSDTRKASVRRPAATLSSGPVAKRKRGYSGATVRTVCVRPTDGFYFPVSYSTTSANFDADQQACAAMCPGHSMYLFYHPTGELDAPEAMISASDGSSYADLPAAFAFRDRYDSSISCDFKPTAPAPAVTAIAGDERRVAIADARSSESLVQPPQLEAKAAEPVEAPSDDGLRGALASQGGIEAVTRVREVGNSFFPNR